MAIFYIIGITIVAITVIVFVILRNIKIRKELINRANQGDAQAQYDLSIKYQHRKPGEALRLFEESAKNGHARAQLELGIKYKEGNNVEKNLVQGFHWLEQAAEQGLADAQFELGYCYMTGQGINEDDIKAFNWFEKAAANGSTNARTFKSLADVQYKMALDNKDPAKAITWFIKAADQGHVDAQYKVALNYLTGKEEIKDAAKAVSWLIKAVNQNHADAQYELGCCYMRGDGVAENKNQAINWFEKAVSNGSVRAQEVVGFKKIEQDSRFKSAAKVFVKEIQYELVKAGYNLSYTSADSYAQINVGGGPKDDYGGHINIWSSEEDEEGLFISSSYGATGKLMMIIDEKRGLEICSCIPSEPRQFPKWLKICASLLKGKVSDPKWINDPEMPWLKDYINSVLKI